MTPDISYMGKLRHGRAWGGGCATAEWHSARLQHPCPAQGGLRSSWGGGESISAALGRGFPHGAGCLNRFPLQLAAKQEVLFGFGRSLLGLLASPRLEQTHTWGLGGPIWDLVCTNDGHSGHLEG